MPAGNTGRRPVLYLMACTTYDVIHGMYLGFSEWRTCRIFWWPTSVEFEMDVASLSS